MRFSLANLLVLTAITGLLLAATFAMPAYIGFFVHCFISLVILPPFIFVGVLSTRGRRQAFFAGAMVAGVPHFVLCVYFAVLLAFNLADQQSWVPSDSESYISMIHIAGYGIGLLGGLSGVCAHVLFASEEGPENRGGK